MKKVLILLVLTLCYLVSCNKKDDDPAPKHSATSTADTFFVNGNYTNYSGQSPSFSITKADLGITYGTPIVTSVTTKDGQRIRVSVPNIQIIKSNIGYLIDSFQFEEWNADSKKWQYQSEFQTRDTSQLSKLATVLVLDMSGSITPDVNKLKSVAKDFVKSYGSKKIGYLSLILFNEKMYPFGFTTDTNLLITSIDTFKTYRNATTLFGAVSRGLSALDSFNQKVDGKILIAFTDGGDNNTNDPTYVKNSIKNQSFTKYAIGVKGKTDYDPDALKNYIVSNVNNFVEASNYDGLSNAFNTIFKRISSISRVEYDRTTQQFNNLDPPVQVRIKIYAHSQ